MSIKSTFRLSVIVYCFVVAGHAQTPVVDIGSPAPSLRLGEWIKGSPLKKFEKGKVYVLEFWATWCKPCIAAMPGLSELARKYKDRVTVIGIDIYENKATTLKKIKSFVDSMGRHMDYRVATENGNMMELNWLSATGEKDNGIPRTFIINAEGKLAWVGHPSELAAVLPKVVNKTWNIREASDRRRFNRYL